MHGLKKPPDPKVPFDTSDIKRKEMDELMKKARAKSSPGKDGVSYKV